jgi:hypothetical protein
MPRRVLVLLERCAAEKALGEAEARRMAGHRAAEEEYELRRNEIGRAVISLRLLIQRADRQPTPRFGRPRKRPVRAAMARNPVPRPRAPSAPEIRVAAYPLLPAALAKRY